MKFNYQSHSLKPGIYKITNTHTGRIYIGQAKRFKERWKSHSNSLVSNRHHNQFLQNDYNKCKEELGNDHFLVFDIIEVLENSTKEFRTEREQFYINQYYDNKVNCYNLEKKAITTEKPKVSKEELIKKLSDLQKEKWSDPEYKKESLSKLHDGKLKALEDPERRKDIGNNISTAKKLKADIASKQAKERWSDPEFKEKTKTKMKEIASSEEVSINRKKAREALLADPDKLQEYKKKCSEHAKRIWELGLIKETEESRKNKSDAAKKRIADGKAEHLKKTSYKQKYEYVARLPNGEEITYSSNIEMTKKYGIDFNRVRCLKIGKTYKGVTLVSKKEIK